MQYERSLSTVELHTCGETFRLVTQGLPKVPGDTIVERRAWLQENADHYRRAVMLEPRGHKDLYGGYLTEAVTAEADFGVIFLNNMGYSPHCGHGVIALATAAVELGWIARVSPETRVGIDAPCGFIEAFVEWDGTRAGSVRFVNVPSFIFERDVTVETPTFGMVTGDIAYGGATYFYVDGRPFDIAIREKTPRCQSFTPRSPNSMMCTASWCTATRAKRVPRRRIAVCTPTVQLIARPQDRAPQAVLLNCIFGAN
jgi:trans-L-3-hydroxyproline dehydratase